MPADLDTLLSIRATVLALGQKGAADWWSCSFLTANGERFLASPFPRSAYWAALHASTIAAARHHDERIGTGGTIHLFRLGQELELKLRDRVLREGWSPDLAGDSEQQVLLNSLKALAEQPEDVPPAGPHRISDPKRFTGPKTLAQVAGLYAAAFENGTQILPYGSDK
ncbi:MAG: BrxE family protein [Verrucomicrobiales bacterium]|nr:BrxE family protein [Verrucomicrobiales bacterium]